MPLGLCGGLILALLASVYFLMRWPVVRLLSRLENRALTGK